MSCAQQNEEGVWVSPAGTNSVTRAELRFNCQDQILNGEPYPPGPPWYVHLWGACSPTDCDWGEVGARRMDNGVIFGVYDHGFAKRGVYLQSVAPGELWLFVATHFTDGSGRADYETELLLHREQDAFLDANPQDLDAFRKRKLPKGQLLTAMRADPMQRAQDSGLTETRPKSMPIARTRL